jgi:hypothetical protein
MGTGLCPQALCPELLVLGAAPLEDLQSVSSEQRVQTFQQCLLPPGLTFLDLPPTLECGRRVASTTPFTSPGTSSVTRPPTFPGIITDNSMTDRIARGVPFRIPEHFSFRKWMIIIIYNHACLFPQSYPLDSPDLTVCIECNHFILNTYFSLMSTY